VAELALLVLGEPGGGWHAVEHALACLLADTLAVGGEDELEGPAVIRRRVSLYQPGVLKAVDDRGDPGRSAVKARGEVAHEHGLARLEMLQGVRLHRGDRELGGAGVEVMLDGVAEVEQRVDDGLGQRAGLVVRRS